TEAGKYHQPAQSSRQKSRLQNQISNQQAIKSKNCQRIDARESMNHKAERTNRTSDQTYASGKQREISVHWLEQMIEKKRYYHVAGPGDHSRGGTHPAASEESQRSSCEGEWIKDSCQPRHRARSLRRTP